MLLDFNGLGILAALGTGRPNHRPLGILAALWLKPNTGKAFSVLLEFNGLGILAALGTGRPNHRPLGILAAL